MNPMILFHRPYLPRDGLKQIEAAVKSGRLEGNSGFSKKVQERLSQLVGAKRAFLTPSCTAALEMATLVMDLRPGEEVIMPSFGFVSIANAVALRGACPVFVDIEEATLNLALSEIEGALTDKTRAIMALHYSGVACPLDELMALAKDEGILVLEDAAHAVGATYKGRPLGGIGDFGAVSFHDTKNLSAGEGGALFVNNAEFVEKAHVVQDKGTDRCRFLQGEIDRYTWQSLGSSFLVSELVAAWIDAGLEELESLTDARRRIWNQYHSSFEELEKKELLKRPQIPESCGHNAHIYFVLLPNLQIRDRVLHAMKERGVECRTHYVPLHDSPAGQRYGRVSGDLSLTDSVAERILRLPIYREMESRQEDIIQKFCDAINSL